MTSKKHIPVVAVHGGAWKIPEELKEGSAFGCRDAASIAYRFVNKIIKIIFLKYSTFKKLQCTVVMKSVIEFIILKRVNKYGTFCKHSLSFFKIIFPIFKLILFIRRS